MRDPRVRLLSLSGELDLSSQRQVHAELSEAAGDRTRELVIDMRGVTFTDSSGLAMIVHTHQQFERQGRSLACVVRDGPVQRMLDATGLAGELLVFDTPEQATEHVLRGHPEPNPA